MTENDPEDDAVRRFLAWLATAATLTVTLPVAGGQNDPRLDDLFARLAAAPSAEQAHKIEHSIWRIWHGSGSEQVDAIVEQGLSALSYRDHLTALEAFDDVVRLAPGFAEGWNKRATVHYLMGNHRASIADIERTLALEPRHFGALSGLGLIHLALDDEAAALAAFDRALAIHPRLSGAETHIRALREKLRGKAI